MLVVLAYLPNFTGEFILSDKPLIQNNTYIKRIHSIPSYLFQEDGITNNGQNSRIHTGYYRPLINLTYWLDYKVWGMKGFGFRITNILFHILTCFVLLRFFRLVIQDRLTSFWMVVLFAVHPIHTETISWVISRNNIFVTLFSFLSLYFYIIGREGKRYIARFGSIIFFVCAILSKEFGLVLLPIFILYENIMIKRGQDIVSKTKNYLPFILISFLYLLMRRNVTGSILTPAEMGDIWTRIYFSPYLVLQNIKLIFFPFGLHSFIIGYPDSYLNGLALTGFAFICLLFIYIWKERRNSIVCFGLLSSIFAFMPVLNIAPTSAPSLISMRWLYFPMTFLFLALSAYMVKLLRTKRVITQCILALIIIYFVGYTYALNKGLWHDDETFFRQEVLGFHNEYYTIGLAEILLENKNYKEAEIYFRKVMDNHIPVVEDYINYSALLMETGRSNEALKYLNEIKEIKMSIKKRGEWHNNMGMAYFHLKRQVDALSHFKKAVIYSPYEAWFWSNLGSTYGSMGDYTNAVSAFKGGLNMSPNSIEIKRNLAFTYLKMENFREARHILESIPIHDREKNKDILEMWQKAHEGL
jgi:tetratricopeptide (TPR) repeat protein